MTVRLGKMLADDSRNGPPKEGEAGAPPKKTPEGDKSKESKHGSQPFYSRGDDLAVAESLRFAIAAAKAKGLHHAAAHLKHYLDGDGRELTIDPADLLEVDPYAQNEVKNAVAQASNNAVERAQRTGRYGTTKFNSGWKGQTVDRGKSEDWYLAVGSYHVATTGEVTVHPPKHPGADPEVTVKYRAHIVDRYNWDREKHTMIAGRKISDATMDNLNTAGMAHNYDIRGTSREMTYSGKPPTASQLPPVGQQSR